MSSFNDHMRKLMAHALVFSARGAFKLSSNFIEVSNTLYKGARIVHPEIEITEDIEVSAYHEAGHAVILHHFHQDEAAIRELSLLRDLKNRAAVHYHPLKSFSQFNPHDAYNFISVMLAGSAAEKIKYGFVREGNANDMHYARVAAARLVHVWGIIDSNEREQAVKEIMDQAFADTETHLRQNWDTVEAVAQAALKKKILLGYEVIDMIDMQKRPDIESGPLNDKN